MAKVNQRLWRVPGERTKRKAWGYTVQVEENGTASCVESCVETEVGSARCSVLATSARRCSGARWAYLMVMARVAWPSISFNAWRLPPRMTNQEAKWCRQSWRWKSSSLASATAFSNAVLTLRVLNTRPSRGPGRLARAS
jgi:hypothetical protein